MEANNEQRKQAARNLFLHTDKTRAEIADIIDINSKTLYLWIKHGRWEEMKTASRQTPSTLLQDMYDHIEAINNKIRSREDRCPTFQEVEMLRKLFASTKHIQKLNIGTYIEAFTELTTFINEHDHDLGIKVLNLTDRYIKGLVKPRPEAYKNVHDVNLNLEEMKAQEEKDLATIQRSETPAVTDTTTAIIIPLPVTPHNSSESIPETTDPAQTPVIPSSASPAPASAHTTPVFCPAFLKNASSTFARPPLTHHYCGSLTQAIGHHRARFHIITNSRSNK